MRYDKTYCIVLFTALTALAGCAKEPLAEPEKPKVQIVRVYIDPMGSAGESSSRSVPEEEIETGISVSCDTGAGVHTRAQLGVGELSPLEESAIADLGGIDIYVNNDTYEMSTTYRYLTPSSWITQSQGFVEFAVPPFDLETVKDGDGLVYSMALINTGDLTGNLPPFEENKFTLDFETQSSVTPGGKLPMVCAPDELRPELYYDFYAERIPAKIDFTLTIKDTGQTAVPLSQRVELTSIQLKNVPKSVNFFGSRSPVSQSGDDSDPVDASYYQDYAEISNIANPGSFVAGQRYVWYMPPNYDYMNSLSNATNQNELTLANASHLAYLPTYLLIKGRYKIEDNQNSKYENFELTICPTTTSGGRFRHMILSNQWFRINLTLVGAFVQGDERLVMNWPDD